MLPEQEPFIGSKWEDLQILFGAVSLPYVISKDVQVEIGSLKNSKFLQFNNFPNVLVRKLHISKELSFPIKCKVRTLIFHEDRKHPGPINSDYLSNLT